jgi:putative SOS response-associated peptidase YedK
MCGRFHLGTPAVEVARIFGVERVGPELGDWRPRYNIAPTQDVMIIREELPQGAERAVRALVPARWGLVPYWADDAAMHKMINARSEDAAEKPAFRSAFERRRCLVPADGFYEWKKLDSKRKQPMLIRRRDGRPFVMAGLWERWRPRGQEGEWLETCAVLTCAPNSLVAEIHDRMPVILPEAEISRWLDVREREAAKVVELMRAAPAEEMEAVAVSTRVNSVQNDDQACIDTTLEEGAVDAAPRQARRPRASDGDASGTLFPV